MEKKQHNGEKEKKANPPNHAKLIWLIVGLLAFVVVAQFLNNLRFAEALKRAESDNVQVTNDFASLGIEEEVEEEKASEDDAIVDLFQYVEKLGSDRANQTKYTQMDSALKAYLAASETLAAWKAAGLRLQSGLRHDLIDTENATVFLTLELDDTGSIHLLRSNEKIFTLQNPADFETLKQKISETITADLPSHRAQVKDRAVAQKKEIDDLKAKFESLKSDEGFQALLQKNGMTWVGPAEDDFYIFYELRSTDGTAGKVLRTVSLDKATGEIVVKEPGQAQGSLLKDLLRVGDDDVAFILPTAADLSANTAQNKKDINLLIAGKSGSNVDTLIFANIDPAREKITLLSIPRDLYYKERKINSVYANGGMNQLTKELSEITGYKIEDYMLVDMVVFKDLIDLVGGVDVTLETDLVDPTYKVFRNGVASTLHYSAGDHHLDGSEALRIARSRYSTSDYSRAERQQLILEGLKKKAESLGASDLPTFLKLLKTALSKTETSLRLDEAARYYLGYKNFALEHGNVLSSGNVLQSALLPVEYNTSLKVEICPGSSEGQPSNQTIIKIPSTQTQPNNPACAVKNAIYTLEPRDGNWDYIKWYVREAVE